MNEQTEIILTESVVRWRIVSVVALAVSAFALMMAIGAGHEANKANNRVEVAERVLKEGEATLELQRRILSTHTETVLKLTQRALEQTP
jgi:hypothetical protein